MQHTYLLVRPSCSETSEQRPWAVSIIWHGQMAIE